jgi:aminopeptidase
MLLRPCGVTAEQISALGFNFIGIKVIFVPLNVYLMQTMEEKYADLLVHYCLGVQSGDQVLINSTTLAEPLIKEVYRSALNAGAACVEVDLSFREKEKIFLEQASDQALGFVPLQYSKAIESFDCFLAIRAPYNLREMQNVPSDRSALRQKAMAPLQKLYFERTADRRLRRNLCQYPTEASAQEASMSLTDYTRFVYQACKLNEPDPKAAWLQVRADQQAIVDHMNQSELVHYKGDGIDLKFSCKGRIWINSDGQTNMPSGEVYTSPVEESVQGVVHFSYPCIYQGHEVEGVTLWVKDGLIEKWEAKRGKDYLDLVFGTIAGTRRFGEAAIGTNYGIDRMTKNILFDEKIGGTIHLAIGQSYLQTGGKNESAVHWDMITDMTNGGEIYTDGIKIYQDGRFLIG